MSRQVHGLGVSQRSCGMNYRLSFVLISCNAVGLLEATTSVCTVYWQCFSPPRISQGHIKDAAYITLKRSLLAPLVCRIALIEVQSACRVPFALHAVPRSKGEMVIIPRRPRHIIRQDSGARQEAHKLNDCMRLANGNFPHPACSHMDDLDYNTCIDTAFGAEELMPCTHRQRVGRPLRDGRL